MGSLIDDLYGIRRSDSALTPLGDTTPDDVFGGMLTDSPSVYAPVPERKPVDKSLWSKLAWVDAPRNGLFDILWRVTGGEANTIPDAVRGFKNDEHVSGVDLINSMARHFDPDAEIAWRIKAAQMGLMPDEVSSALLAKDHDELDRLSNPYGTMGKIVGFGLEFLLDPLNIVSAVITGPARIGAQAARAAGLERNFVQSVVSADAMTVVDMVKGARSPMSKRVFAVPGNIEKAIDIKAQRALGFAEEIDGAEAKMKALFEAKSLVPQMRQTGRKLGAAKRAMTLGEEGADAAFASAREALDGTKAQYASLMELSRDLTPREMLLGAASMADKGVLAEVHAELDAALSGAMTEGVFARAATQYGHPSAGIGMLTESGKRVAQHLEDLTLYMHPGLGRNILKPDMASYEALLATSRARSVVDSLGRTARLNGDATLINGELMGEVVKRTAGSKVPADTLAVAGPEIVDGIEESRRVAALLNDDSFINRYFVVPTAGDLVRYSQEDMAAIAYGSSVLKQLSQKLYANTHGWDVLQSRAKITGKWEPVDQLTGNVRDLKPKIGASGKGFLSKKEAQELAAQHKQLSDALDNFAIKSRENIANVMEAMYAQQAAIKPDSWLGQQVAKLPLAKRLTMPMSPTPMFGFFLGRDPERVFRGTGAFELLMERTRTFTEADAYYQGIRREITKGLSQTERRSLGQAMLAAREAGKAIPEEELAALGPKVTDAYRRIRELRQEMADLQGMPYEERVSEYFTRLIDRDEMMSKALSEGHIPPEFTRDSPVIGDMLKRSEVAREWKSRFLKRAGAPTGEYIADVDEVMRVYIKTSLKAHYLSPAFKEAGNLLMGSEIRSGAYDAAGKYWGAKATPGIVNIRAANDPKVMGMVSYLKDLENTVHGIPTRLTEKIAGGVANVADEFGWEFANTPEKAVSFASKISGALVRNTYRSTIAGLTATPLQNITQNILTAGEYGPMTTWKSFVRTIAKQDPMEHLIAGGNTADLYKIEKEKLLQNFGDMYDLSAPPDTLRGRTARLVKFYDHYMFKPMAGSEALNRGVAFAVGLNYAKRMNLGVYDSLRMAHQVSDETQFLYGMMGRAPLFHDPFLRPIVGPFSSYPQKMAGSLARMLGENPTSFMRYLTFMGGMSNAVSRLDIDPANLFNFAYLPNRFLFIAPITPLARGLKSTYDFAMSDEGSAAHDQAKVGMVEGFMYGGLMPLPIGSVRDFWKQYKLWRDDEVLSSREFTKHQIPGLSALFDDEIPKVLLREDDTAHKLAISVAKMFGFHSEAESIANRVQENINDARNEYAKLRKDIVRIYKRNGNFADLDDEDRAKLQELAKQGGPDAIRDLVKSINDGYRTITDRSLDNVSRSQERRIRSGIAGVPDPEIRRSLLSVEQSRKAMQRDVDERLGRRVGPDNVSPEWGE